MHIVIIDDDDAFRMVLERGIKRLSTGATVTSFAAPPPALEYVQSNPVTAILLDMKLAGDSGLLWIEPLRQAAPQAKLVVITGYASIATTVQAIKLGADNYLPKPLTADIVVATLNDQLPEQNADAEQVMSLRRIEWEHIQRALDDNQGNVSAAARQLGMHRRTLQRKLQKRPASNS